MVSLTVSDWPLLPYYTTVSGWNRILQSGGGYAYINHPVINHSPEPLRTTKKIYINTDYLDPKDRYDFEQMRGEYEI